MRDLAFVASWLLLVPLAFGGAQVGVLLWTWTSLLAPNDVLYGFGSTLPYTKVAAALTLGLAVMGRGGGIRLRLDATVALLVLLAVWGLLSQATGLAGDSASGWELYQKFAKILLLAVMVMAVMRDRLRLHALMLAICLGIGFTGLGEAAKFLLSAGGHKVLGTASTGDNNQIALDVLMIMPLLYYLQATARRQAVRVTCWVMGGMCAVCVVATASRDGFAGLGLLGVAYVLASRRKALGLLLVLLVFGIGAQLVSDSWKERISTIQSAESDDSFLGRVGAWKVSTAVALHRPLFGGGFHAIQHGDVWGEHLEAASHVAILGSAPPTLNLKAAHSIYFEVLGDLGFGGLVLFLALFAVGWRNGTAVRRIVRRSKRADIAWAGQMAAVLQVSVLLFLVNGALLSAAYYDIDYLLVAMLAALRELVGRTVLEGPPGVVHQAPDASWRSRAAAERRLLVGG